ncbi:hypothetical protein [Streptacidiphilus carbonis]|uniref:hypothetical protein n=1 Tax=Streptacidiphilus carbonis TaxID=105422 RepID=UPI0005A89903|nr:hypothetical protein [Streptacidiphilus carbonis]
MADEDAGEVARGELLSLYIESVRARMDEAHFVVFLKAIRGLVDFAESRGKLGVGELDDGEEQLKGEVMTEVMQAAGILVTGRMDHQVVDLGGGILALVTPEQAADPAVLERMRQNCIASSRRRREQADTLDGIAEASGL